MRHVEARTGAYADSVTLMQVTATAQAVPGVRAALVAMATELNLGLLAGLGLSAPDGTDQNDMLVAVEAADDEALAAALAAIDGALRARPAQQASGPADQPPRTTLSAARQAGPSLALISVPGPYAFAEAADALEAGCDVMIFSDNVPVEQEIWLKDRAAQHGLLVMGPDCGTAVVGGVGLGFSHSVAAGPIGVVAASGTGAQQLICLLDAAGTGVSAVLGLGGRDLSAAVGGRSARAALAALDEDPATELIVLLSKPPDPQVASDLRAYSATLATPVEFALIGIGQPDLSAAAEAALRRLGRPVPDWPVWRPGAEAPTLELPSPGLSSSQAHSPGKLGAPADGTPADGADTEGTPPDRAHHDGPPADGPGHEDASHKGVRYDGAGHEGASHDGASHDGTPADGAGHDGTPADRVGHDGAEQDGAVRPRALRGLFSGGTLCDEAMVIAAERLGPVYSNIPLQPDCRIDPAADTEPAGARHTMIDFGDDALTAGRPHPMIDLRLRLDRLAAAAADPTTGVILLDVVLGYGAHPDPAAELAPAIKAARSAAAAAGRRLPIVVSLIGARSDPQDQARQARLLASAGAHVFASNAAAARSACDLISAKGGYS